MQRWNIEVIIQSLTYVFSSISFYLHTESFDRWQTKPGLWTALIIDIYHSNSIYVYGPDRHYEGTGYCVSLIKLHQQKHAWLQAQI